MKPEPEVLAFLAAISGHNAPDHQITSLKGKALLKNNRTGRERKARNKKKIANTSRRRNRS